MTRGAGPPSRADGRDAASPVRRPSAAHVAALATLIALILPAGAAADTGFRDFSFGSGITAPTAEKPQSKVWFGDGQWWSVMYNDLTARYEIWQLDPSTEAWQSTGAIVDERENTRADALWDGTHLYVVSAGTSSSDSADDARLMRYSYNAGAKTYTLDSGYPVELTNGGSSAVTIAKDDTGRLWVAYTQGTKVYLSHSTSNDHTWRSPYVMPAPGAADVVAGEDEAAIVAFDDKVGVMWSNQSPDHQAMYWATHVDGAADDQWAPNTARQGFKLADNHINLKALDGDPAGQVFAAAKTSNTAWSEPLIELLVLKNGAWTRHVYGTVTDNHTRAIVSLDPARRLLYVFAAGPCCSGGRIYFKQSSLDSVSFTPGLGSVFIESSSDPKINNPTSTKQPATNESGLLVMAGDDTTHRYLHNRKADGAPETNLESGPSGTVRSNSATFTFSANRTGVSFECKLDAGAYQPCSSPRAYADLEKGQHTFQVRALSQGENLDPTPATRTWTVESTSTTAAYAPVADAHVNGDQATRNFGTATALWADRSPSEESYLRFQVGGISGAVQEAKLRLRVSNGTGNGPAIHTTTSAWSELGLTYNNRPAATSTAHDDKAGVAAGAWVEYDVKPFVTGNGSYDLKLVADSSDGMDFASREAASNRPELVVTSNSGPPETTIDSAPTDPAGSSLASFKFSADKSASFECRLDGSGFEPCTSPKTYGDLPDGQHSFEVRAVDETGQIDPTPATHSWRVDSTAPSPPQITNPADGATFTDSTVTLTGSAEPLSTVEVFDGHGSQGAVVADSNGAWSMVLSDLSDGSHELSATAMDAADNVSAPSESRTVTVDVNAPETVIDSGPSGHGSSSSATLSFSADDPQALFLCSLDGEPQYTCSSPHELSALGEGAHTFEVQAVDASGNPDPTPASRSWSVDTTAPSVSSTLPADADTGTDLRADARATFSEELDTATVTADTMKLVRQSDSSPVAAAVRPAADGLSADIDPDAPLDANTTYTAVITGGGEGVKDLAGNPLAGDYSWSFTTAADSPPQTTIDSGPSGTIGTASASFGFSADLPGSSFECSLDGQAFASCSSPKAYTELADGEHSFEVRATGPSGTLDPTPARRTWTVETLIFDDGFELGSFTKWSSVVTGADGTAAVQGATVKTGDYAARLSETALTGSVAYARKILASSERDLSVSGDFRIDQEGLSGGNVPLFRLYNASGTRQVSLYRQNASGDKVRLTHSDLGVDTSGRLPLGKWGHFKLHVVAAGTSASTVEVFLDGVQVYRTTDASVDAAGVKTLQIGNDTSRQAFTLVADNIEARR